MICRPIAGMNAACTSHNEYTANNNSNAVSAPSSTVIVARSDRPRRSVEADETSDQNR